MVEVVDSDRWWYRIVVELTEDRDFKEAVKMGRKALQLFAHGQGHRLDDLSLQLLLGAERRSQRGWG